MTYETRTGQTLSGVDPHLAEKLGRVLAAMAVLGHPMVAYEGRRTLERQQQLYAQGRTLPGRIVTQCDGMTRKSLHQTGRACDCGFVARGDGLAPWRIKWEGPWEAFGACAEAVGLRWGGRFTTIDADKPHVELP